MAVISDINPLQTVDQQFYNPCLQGCSSSLHQKYLKLKSVINSNQICFICYRYLNFSTNKYSAPESSNKIKSVKAYILKTTVNGI